MPTWIVRFDEDGTCTSPKTRTALLEKLAAEPKPTHVIFMSHGWNSDFSDAIGQYRAFLKAFEKVTDDRKPQGDYRPIFVGVTWPSVWFPLDKGPRLAGPAAEPAARDGIIDSVADELDAGTKKRLEELTKKERLTPAEMREAAAILLPSMNRADDTDLKREDLDVETAVAAAARIQGLMQPQAAAETPGTVNLGALDAGAAGAPTVAGLEWLDPRNILRMFSLYKMKDRAGRVGSKGVADLLRKLVATGLPIHLVGHSFGCKVMLSALCNPAALAKPAASALLLQPAVSHLCFAETVPGRSGSGGYRAALKSDRVARPIFSTYSRSDFPLHDVFHSALQRRADLGEARIAAGDRPPNEYAALGGYGPRGAAEQLIDPIKKPGDAYSIEAGKRLVGLDGSAEIDYPAAAADARIACHGCVANAYTAWALYQQMF
jgi:hypothetical protein